MTLTPHTAAGTATPESPMLRCETLTKTFASRRGPIAVLGGITFGLQRGEIILVTGRSGAGKSTLLGLLSGLERPTSGTITFAGTRLDQAPDAALSAIRRERMGIIFQDFHLLLSWTALENVEAPLMHGHLHPTERRRRAMGLLEELGLGDRLHHLPGELSAGQRQRVAVARALINRPEIVFADEPAGDVDPETAGEIHGLLVQAARERGTAVVVASHGGFPASIADRVLQLSGGTLTGAGGSTHPNGVPLGVNAVRGARTGTGVVWRPT